MRLSYQTPGLFISLEGVDGAGKSKHVAFIQDYINSLGVKAITCREPGGTVIGEKIRELLLYDDKMHEITELLLMCASRQELIHNIIYPHLKNNHCVISDRFIDSSIVYQGVGRNIGIDKVKTLYQLLETPIIPHLTLVFDASIEVILTRINKHKQKDRIEQEKSDFFINIQNAYHQLMKSEPNRIKIINTDGVIEATRDEIVKHLDAVLGKISNN